MRVVSLVPSATETLLALGVDVAACTRFCERPELPHVGGTKNPDVGAIVALAPELVVMDEEENRLEDAEALQAAGLALHVTAVRSVDAALAAVGELARATGRPPPPISVRIPAVVPDARRTAFMPIWRRPWMSVNADTYGASVLASLGIDVVTADDPDRYPMVDLATIAARRPDLVLVPSEPYAFTDEHVAELTASVAGADVRRVDGQDLFWWGIRTPAARRRLRSAAATR
ncbi:MAG: helical backbone metal receptor [Ilumatobacteraceae bacterium]